MPQDTDVSFTVELSRSDVPVQWLKNGLPIPENQKEKFQLIKEKNVYKMIVQRAQKDDAAEYSCVAGNVRTTTKLQVQGKSFNYMTVGKIRTPFYCTVILCSYSLVIIFNPLSV